MSGDWKTFELPDRVESVADSGLHAFLLAHSAAPVRISVAQVRRIDTRLLQYLMAAARDWAGRSLDFAVVGVGAQQAAVLTLIGVTPDLLPWSEGAA